MSIALMWEAKAAEGRGEELHAWARARARGLRPAPERCETFTAAGGRVLVISWWGAGDAGAVPGLPDPPPALVARPVHRWHFTPHGAP